MAAMIEDHKISSDPLRKPDEAEAKDAVEIWGRRVSRILGAAFAIFLVWRLITTYILAPA